MNFFSYSIPNKQDSSTKSTIKTKNSLSKTRVKGSVFVQFSKHLTHQVNEQKVSVRYHIKLKKVFELSCASGSCKGSCEIDATCLYLQN